MTQNNDKKFYLVGELSKELRVSNMTIYRYIQAGKLKAYKIGRDLRINKKDYNNFLNKAKVK